MRRLGSRPFILSCGSALIVATALVGPVALADSRPDGPSPSSVLAADPARVPLPATAASPGLLAAPSPSCPVTSGVHNTAPGTGKTVALTFDDGPGTSTAQIIAILVRYGVPATFFNVGINQTVRPALVRTEAAKGFVLGNHTWSHPQLTTLTQAQQQTELDATGAEQAQLIGRAACVFRPPYGSYNSATLTIAANSRLGVWTWSVDTEDWKATSASSSWVSRIVTLGTAVGTQQHPVVLMHNSPAGNPATVAALPTIIGWYRSHGFTFVDLEGRTLPPDAHGDFAADGWTDLLARDTTTGEVYLYPRSSSAYGSRTWVASGWTRTTQATRLGDVNGDGRDDVITRDDATGDLLLRAGTGTGLAAPVRVGNGWNGMREITMVGDLDRNGSADLVAINATTGALVRYSWGGTAFAAGRTILTGQGGLDELTGVGDFTRDGYPDLVARVRATGDLVLFRGTSTGLLSSAVRIGTGWNGMRDVLGIGDYNRDGYPDVLAVNRTNQILYLYAGTGSGLRNGAEIGGGWGSLQPLF